MNAFAIFDDKEQLAEAAATWIAARLADAVAARGRALWALAGGGTPRPVYRRLAAAPLVNAVPWTAVQLLWGDERAVPPDDEGSNYGQARADLLDHVPLPAENIHRVRGEWSPEEAAAHYAATLAALAPAGAQWPRLDVALLGLGSDGHTASLFPGPIGEETLTAPVATVNASYDGRPARRVTLTPVVFNAARHLLFLVTGGEKATAVAATWHAPHSDVARWPAARLRPAGGAVHWFLDRAAAAQLTDSLVEKV